MDHGESLPVTGNPSRIQASFAEARCPVCACAIGQDYALCPRCSTPHHHDCFAYVGGCAIFGCEPVAGREIDAAAFRGLEKDTEAWLKHYRRLSGSLFLLGLGLVLLPLSILLFAMAVYDSTYIGLLFLAVASFINIASVPMALIGLGAFLYSLLPA